MGNSNASSQASDLVGAWSISWTDDSGSSGEFRIEIKSGKAGLPYIVNAGEDLPLQCEFILGNTNLNGQAASFTIAVSLGGRTASYNFKIPQLGGSGTFSGSALLCDGLKDAQGTCTSTKLS